MSLRDFTELDAVNLALSAVGQTPVTSLGSGANALAAQAENILDEANREVQAEGWWFNTEKDVEFDATKDNEILLGDDIFFVDSKLSTENYVKRGGRLYDLTNHTFTFDSGTTVSLDIIRSLDWLDMPILARQFIARKAARILVERYLNDATIIQSTARDELLAKQKMTTENARQSDRNFLRDNPIRWASLNRGGRGAIERGLI